jgi:hypothetical protein
MTEPLTVDTVPHVTSLSKQRFIETVVVLSTLTACASDGRRVGGPSAGAPSFSCISARAAVGLTQGTSVSDARQVLRQAIVAPDSSKAERDFFTKQLDALASLPLDEPIGSHLDSVPCDLR